MIKWLKLKWCDWFHGGHIKRDHYGRINWQCNTCGRWGTPVDKQTEELMIESHIQAHIKSRTHSNE